MVKDIAKARASLISIFPKLSTDPNFMPTSEIDRRYNCIAWAMRLNDRRVCADDDSASWWPIEITNTPSDNTKKALIKAFRAVGYRECPMDYYSKYYDVVALYYNPLNHQWTHAARVIAPGVFHSKMGDCWDIHHSGKDFLNNPYSPSNYGLIYQYMRRSKFFRGYSLVLCIKRISIMFINELRCLF